MPFSHNQTMKQRKKSRGIEILEHLNISPEEYFPLIRSYNGFI